MVWQSVRSLLYKTCWLYIELSFPVVSSNNATLQRSFFYNNLMSSNNVTLQRSFFYNNLICSTNRANRPCIASIKKEDVVLLQWDNCPQEIKMTQKLTTIGNRTAFNNEQSPYRIVGYKRPRNDNIKQFKRENYRPYLCKKKMNEKQICNT